MKNRFALAESRPPEIFEISFDLEALPMNVLVRRADRKISTRASAKLPTEREDQDGRRSIEDFTN